MNKNFEDFTEESYRKMLCLCKMRWDVIGFSDAHQPGRTCLWRHDIDYSIHRARSLAKIETEENITSTYFVMLHSSAYSVMETETFRLLKEIIRMEHNIGLHFDASFYQDAEDIEPLIYNEKILLEKLLDTSISAISFHNPEQHDLLRYNNDEIAGMTNAYGSYIRQNFTYCSDSNGYWRFQRLEDLLRDGTNEKLHILTHPCMWTPEPMSPRDRISRCFDSRAIKQHENYDRLLADAGRENVGAKK